MLVHIWKTIKVMFMYVVSDKKLPQLDYEDMLEFSFLSDLEGHT